MIRASYNLQRPPELLIALEHLRGYWKLWSACLLEAVSLPTLQGLIVTRAAPALEIELRDFLRGVKADHALLRHDKVEEMPHSPRGGFLVEKGRLRSALDFFFNENRIVALYEPADPLRNGYNINVLVESPHTAIVEVMGPGFDASDLQRGDLSPHEVFYASIDSAGEVDNLQLAHSVSAIEYAASTEGRYAKIRRKFEAAPAKLFSVAPTDYVATKLPPDHYQPIARRCIASTIGAIMSSDIISVFRRSTGVGYPLNFCSSFVNPGNRQVYWDIVSPTLKYGGLRHAFGAVAHSASRQVSD